MTKRDKNLYTVEEVAGQLQFHPQTVLEYIRSGTLRAVRLGKGYRITQEAFEEFLKDRETSKNIYAITEAKNRIDNVLSEGEFKNRPSLLLSAVFLPEVKVKNIFSHKEGSKNVIELLEQPPVFRQYGWDLQTLDRARPVLGDFLEVKNGERKTIRVYRNGQVIAAGLADEEFLGWAMEKFNVEGENSINGMAVAEFISNFCVFVNEILGFLDSKPSSIMFYLRINNPSNKKLTFRSLVGQWHIPDKKGADVRFVKKEQQIGYDLDNKTQFNPAGTSAKIWAEYCYVFGFREEEIPYLKEENGIIVIDFEVFKKQK